MDTSRLGKVLQWRQRLGYSSGTSPAYCFSASTRLSLALVRRKNKESLQVASMKKHFYIFWKSREDLHSI